VAIYTADGQHFRTYVGSAHEPNLGIKTIEWSPDSNFLALGQHHATIELINSATFTLTMALGDPTLIGSASVEIYRERFSNIGNVHEYTLIPQTPDFPYTYDTLTGAHATSLISFNPTGKLVATVQQGMPHIVWIWSIQCQTPSLVSALIQNSAVRQLLWSPKFPDLLMTTNDGDMPVVHQWIRNRIPRIASIPVGTGGKYAISWIRADTSRNGIFWFGWQTGHIIGYIMGNGSNARFMQAPDVGDDHPAMDVDELLCTFLEEDALP
jgi:WD40 repeat protein